MRKIVVAFLTLALVSIVPSLGVSAVNYNSGTYGSCGYSQCTSTPTTPSPTVATLPSGLEVSINLSNGQLISTKGYTVIVTPLNGQGKTFAKVQFFVGGKMVGEALPRSTGTAYWFWDTKRYYNKNIMVRVFETNLVKRDYSFNVLLQRMGVSTLEPLATNGVDKADNSTETNLIANIPAPVKKSLPYALLLALAVYALVLFLQAYRYRRSSKMVLSSIQRLADLDEAKTKVLQLLSHYLRTPLTLISGGADTLKRVDVPSKELDGLSQAVVGLQASIEKLLSDIEGGSSTPVLATTPTRSKQDSAYYMMTIVFVVICLVVVNFIFSSGTLSESVATIAAQVVLFVSIASFGYHAWRQRLVQREVLHNSNLVEQKQTEITLIKERIMAEATGPVRSYVQSIGQSIAKLPASPATKYMNEGYQRLDDLVSKLAIASSLRESQSQEEMKQVRLSSLIEVAQKPYSELMSSRGLSLRVDSDVAEMNVQNPQLLVYVLQTLLKNAATFADESTEILVQGRQEKRFYTLSVSDNGVELTDQKAIQLMEPFARVDDIDTFDHEGMGLSLYLDKLIMTYLRGSVDIDSHKNTTTVSCYLPTAVA